MFHSTRWHNKFACLLFTFFRLYSPSYLPSSEALLLSIHRTRNHLVSPGRKIWLRHNNCQFRSVRCYSTSLLATDTALYSDLAKQITESYNEKETDGILELAASSSMMVDEKLDIGETLVPAILEASGGRKGVSASIMNALIGSSCFVGDGEESKSFLSSRIFALIEALEDDGDITPDLVTFSLAYRALAENLDSHALADSFLEEAERISKKAAGGKRRKILAASKRQKVSTFVDAEDNLKEILGDDFKVLMETDEFAVVNKPSGIPCFHKKKTTAGKIKKGKGKNKKKSKTGNSSESSDFSLEDALVNCNVCLSTLNPDALGLVHRLDRGSSGCIVLAKTNEMHATLISEFFLRRTTKKYVALLRQFEDSSMPEEESGLIDNPVNRRPARSKYKLLERYQPSSGDDCQDNATMVEFEIFTGRKHQIRVHAAEVLGSPVWGDPIYGSKADKADSSQAGIDDSKRIFLHACHLTIPQLGIDVEAPLPSWWQSKLSMLQRN